MNTSIDNLATVWGSIDRLCSGLEDSQWDLPTGCPGWSVKDVISHLVDYESRALGRPVPEHDPGSPPHVKNDLGKANEIGVDLRRSMSGAAVLEEFREVTVKRLPALRELTEADLAAETMTPAGPGTVADMLTLRVMDGWSHEQDIRRVVGIPGHLEGPAVEEAMEFLTRFLPYLVGKRAAAPDGSVVAFRIGPREIVVEVVDGTGRPATAPREATVTLDMPVATYAALACGRSDAPDDVQVTGDQRLGRRVLDSLGFMP